MCLHVGKQRTSSQCHAARCTWLLTLPSWFQEVSPEHVTSKENTRNTGPLLAIILFMLEAKTEWIYHKIFQLNIRKHAATRHIRKVAGVQRKWFQFYSAEFLGKSFTSQDEYCDFFICKLREGIDLNSSNSKKKKSHISSFSKQGTEYKLLGQLFVS